MSSAGGTTSGAAALELLRAQIAVALAAIDGAFVAGQGDRGTTLEHLLQPLVPSLVASRRTLLAKAD